MREESEHIIQRILKFIEKYSGTSALSANDEQANVRPNHKCCNNLD